MKLNLQNITFYVINHKDDYEKRSLLISRLNKLQLNYELVPAVKCEPSSVGQSLSQLKVLKSENLKLPFAILPDTSILSEEFPFIHDLPEETDALYLGQSAAVFSKNGSYQIQENGTVEFEIYNEHYLRLLNNLDYSCIIYISEKYLKEAIEYHTDALLDFESHFPFPIEYAQHQKEHLVLSPITPICYAKSPPPNETIPTSLYIRQKTQQFSNLPLPNQPNDFEFRKINNEKYYLFYDIFIHHNLKKITAVAPFYGKDMDLSSYYPHITLKVDELSIVGNYIPCRLDSWEPSILIDFEHPALEEIINQKAQIQIEVTCNGIAKVYSLEKYVPGYDISMSIIINNENRWIKYFLEYYLDMMKVNHVYVYDNYTRDKEELEKILKPFIQKSQVTLIPWHYRWRNKSDKKQIGQPPQEAHTLNKYGHGKWIGFFDVDEFLKIPQTIIPAFLQEYDPFQIGGISFGLRWFFYKGSKTFNQIQNPLTEFIYSKEDPQGRKRQKLFVSPKLVRYMGFHWIQEDQKEIKIDDKDIYFHHYYIRKRRFQEGKTAVGKIDRSIVNLYKDYERMNRFSKHIETSFDKAILEQSKVTKEVMQIDGMVGKYTKHFYNNIASLPGCKLLEIGCYKGSSSCSFLEGNWIKATFIDNWSEFDEPKEECIQNIRKHAHASRVKIIAEDCWKVDKAQLDKYNVYLYDGNHADENHYNALIKFYDDLEDIAIVLIDDWNWPNVRRATNKAIKDLKIPIFYEREIQLNEEDLVDMPRHKGKETWWNGIYVFAFNKRLNNGS